MTAIFVLIWFLCSTITTARHKYASISLPLGWLSRIIKFKKKKKTKQIVRVRNAAADFCCVCCFIPFVFQVDIIALKFRQWDFLLLLWVIDGNVRSPIVANECAVWYFWKVTNAHRRERVPIFREETDLILCVCVLSFLLKSASSPYSGFCVFDLIPIHNNGVV